MKTQTEAAANHIRIVTLTMNPALDITTSIDRVHPTEKLRVADVTGLGHHDRQRVGEDAAEISPRLVQQWVQGMASSLGQRLLTLTTGSSLSNLVYGLSARFAAGEIAITDVLPSLRRWGFGVAGAFGGDGCGAVLGSGSSAGGHHQGAPGRIRWLGERWGQFCGGQTQRREEEAAAGVGGVGGSGGAGPVDGAVGMLVVAPTVKSLD